MDFSSDERVARTIDPRIQSLTDWLSQRLDGPAGSRGLVRGTEMLAMGRVPTSGVRNCRIACAIFLAAATGISTGSTAPAQAQDIHDNFDSGLFDKRIWAPCDRRENEIAIVKDPIAGEYAAKLSVYPTSDLQSVSLFQPLRNCIGEKPYDDASERAELWESAAVRLNFGSDVWYSFKMFIDPDISPLESRLIIGQWKGPHDDSPMVAQRFQLRTFNITIEQPNQARGHDSRDVQCRIVVAHDRNYVVEQRTESAPLLGLFNRNGKMQPADRFGKSLGHDLAEAFHTPQSCATDVTIEPHNELPDPFGRWTKMTYHLHIFGDADGLLDVWANDIPIVTVRGQIGAPGKATEYQYFKFGPYRDRSRLDGIYALLAEYKRGPSRQDVQ